MGKLGGTQTGKDLARVRLRRLLAARDLKHDFLGNIDHTILLESGRLGAKTAVNRGAIGAVQAQGREFNFLVGSETWSAQSPNLSHLRRAATFLFTRTVFLVVCTRLVHLMRCPFSSDCRVDHGQAYTMVKRFGCRNKNSGGGNPWVQK